MTSRDPEPDRSLTGEEEPDLRPWYVGEHPFDEDGNERAFRRAAKGVLNQRRERAEAPERKPRDS